VTLSTQRDVPIVCWDFDETLGYFRPLEFAFLGEVAPASMPPASLKPGIAALLAELTDFTHVVTTAAIAQYARGILAGQGILQYFADVLGREHGVFPADGKDYRVVGERFGVPEATLAERLVIVGNDAKRDPDLRGRPIVMIHDEQMSDQPAEPLGVVLRALASEGGGSWRRGFERLHERAGGARAMTRQLVLEDRVRFRIDYWGDFASGWTHPVISRPRMVGR
jgi:hypothetical protein